ncbi:hypothetical protein ACSV4D_09540 [Flavobacterium sp. ARAG 55.4]|uniref:hypothetical protein n=1 Tax=Flavobacterium sp. ARAG 55.4 TaxID=3451357 RepID=UPI003F4831BE
MNKQDFTLNNGFPMNQDALDRMQMAYTIFNALGNIVGDKTIISGCTGTGTVSNGVVYVNGEIFEFRGGVQQTTVIIKEDVTNLVYKNANTYPAVKIRYVTFGTGVGQMNWADFKQGFPTKDIAAGLLGKADQTSFDALADAFALVYTKMLTVEEGAQKNKDEYYQYGQLLTQNRTLGNGIHGDFSKNNVDVFPPEGYTMSHLKAFIPSINKIYFSGDVNGDDALFCDYELKIDRITVICNNTESRANAEVSYLAIWKK